MQRFNVSACRIKQGLFDTVANHNDLNLRSPSHKRGCFHDHTQVLREADFAGMHHGELVGQPVSFGVGILLWPRGDLRTVGPIRDDHRARRVRPLSINVPGFSTEKTEIGVAEISGNKALYLRLSLRSDN